jgi:hypothetical protein
MSLDVPELDTAFRQCKDNLEKANEELHENLRLFAERVMLYRITRAEDKSAELANFSRILLEAGTLSETPQDLLDEISGIQTLAKEKLSRSQETGLFSMMVRATEKLTSKQLYYLLEKLRTGPMVE